MLCSSQSLNGFQRQILANKVLDVTISPWETHPYQLNTWWNMEKFAAAAFYRIGVYLGRARRGLEAHNRDVVLEPTQTVSALNTVGAIREACAHLGLKVSLKCIDELTERCRGNLSVGNFVDSFGELENTIRREMSGIAFFYLPDSRSDFYDQKELFGEVVNQKFPSVQFDMVESGNCYAMGRGTACVFHLMRIMEVGVQEFGKKLGVSLVVEKNWQNILEEINKAIKTLPPKDPGTVEASQAAANLYSVKLGWRNEVMHPNDTYTLEEAENILRQVKIFMAQLAKLV